MVRPFAMLSTIFALSALALPMQPMAGAASSAGTTYSYDDANQKYTVTQPNGNYQVISYGQDSTPLTDDDRQLESGFTSQDGTKVPTIVYTFDDARQRVTVTHSDGTYQIYSYGPDGKPLTGDDVLVESG